MPIKPGSFFITEGTEERRRLRSLRFLYPYLSGFYIFYLHSSAIFFTSIPYIPSSQPLCGLCVLCGLLFYYHRRGAEGAEMKRERRRKKRGFWSTIPLPIKPGSFFITEGTEERRRLRSLRFLYPYLSGFYIFYLHSSAIFFPSIPYIPSSQPLCGLCVLCGLLFYYHRRGAEGAEIKRERRRKKRGFWSTIPLPIKPEAFFITEGTEGRRRLRSFKYLYLQSSDFLYILSKFICTFFFLSIPHIPSSQPLCGLCVLCGLFFYYHRRGAEGAEIKRERRRKKRGFWSTIPLPIKPEVFSSRRALRGDGD